MRISAPGPCERGHTLIELLVVMLIVALGAALVPLAIGSRTDNPLRDDARKLGQFFHRVANEAAARGATLTVRLEAGRLQVSDEAVPAPELATKITRLEIDDRAVPIATPIRFPPVGGERFSLTLDHRGALFTVARDALGRIAVRG